MSDKKYWTEAVTVRDDGQKDVTKIYVVKPSNAINKEADRYRAKTWNQCVSDGVMTHQEVTKILEKRKIWDAEKEQKEADLKKKLTDLQRDLWVGNKDGVKRKVSDGMKIAIEMRLVRNELRELIATKIAMEENTAESLANNARFDYIVASCTYDENDQRVYKDIDTYNAQSSDVVAFAAASKLGEVIFGLDGKFEESLPENKWLKQFNLVDDELSLINKDKKLVNTEGRVVDAEGYYLDANGKRTDKDGNPLNDDGSYQLQVEYEDDAETTTTEKPADS